MTDNSVLLRASYGVPNATAPEIQSFHRRISRARARLEDAAKDLATIIGIGSVEIHVLRIKAPTGALELERITKYRDIMMAPDLRLPFFKWTAKKLGLTETEVQKQYEDDCNTRLKRGLPNETTPPLAGASIRVFQDPSLLTGPELAEWTSQDAEFHLHGIALMRWQRLHHDKVKSMHGFKSLPQQTRGGDCDGNGVAETDGAVDRDLPSSADSSGAVNTLAGFALAAARAIRDSTVAPSHDDHRAAGWYDSGTTRKRNNRQEASERESSSKAAASGVPHAKRTRTSPAVQQLATSRRSQRVAAQREPHQL